MTHTFSVASAPPYISRKLYALFFVIRPSLLDCPRSLSPFPGGGAVFLHLNSLIVPTLFPGDIALKGHLSETGITPSQIPGRHPIAGPLNGGCWPSWKAGKGQKPSNIDIDTINYVNYFFVAVDEKKGTIYSEDKETNEEMEFDGTRGIDRVEIICSHWLRLHKPHLVLVRGDGCCLRAWPQRRNQKPSLKIFLTIGSGQISATAECQKLESLLSRSCPS